MAQRDSISFSVVRRILVALDDHGTTINRTNLATKTGLNYCTCVKYLTFLGLAGWVAFLNEGQGHVSITETGRKFKAILLSGKSPAEPIHGEPVSVVEKSF